jgi:DNA-binding NtrC family response regulator
MKETRRILIIDDERPILLTLEALLSRHGFETETAATAAAGLKALKNKAASLVLLDLQLPDAEGLQMLDQIKTERPETQVIILTAHDTLNNAIESIKRGAFHFISKPYAPEELLSLVEKALEKQSLLRETQQLREKTVELEKRLEIAETRLTPVFKSKSMQEIEELINAMAPSEANVLITGESGVGKEILAEVIHGWSSRASGPLVKVNCAAIPETLLESELFGHEKGSFTGAVAQRIGRFETAKGGTIFLDEIAEMSSQLQAKLLRVVQDGCFQRIGSNTELRADARLLAATNRNLEEEVKAGRFREDLYYRLNVVEMNIPPLRERREDILPLANALIAELTKGRARLSSSVADCLEHYSWPGNVRELRNAMERAALLSGGELILPEHLPAKVRGMASPAAPAGTAPADLERLEEIERQAVLETLRKHQFNRTETAKALGISRRALLYKLQRLREQGCEVDGR